MAKCTTSTFFNNSKFTFVLHAPLELDDDHLAREIVEERLRVDGHGGLGERLFWMGRGERERGGEKEVMRIRQPSGIRKHHRPVLALRLHSFLFPRLTVAIVALCGREESEREQE